MKEHLSRYIFVIFFLGFLPSLQAQSVTVSGALTGNGGYSTLGAAFTAIGGGAQTGSNITITLTGNTVEASTAILTQNDWISLTIVPSGGAMRTVSGDLSSLITFSGADRVIVDGLNTGGNGLTIENTNTSNANTIFLYNDAKNNIFRNCTILGSTTSDFNGTILIGTGTTVGNDSILIDNCNLANSGVNLPAKAIRSQGSFLGVNDHIVINNCRISNYFNAGNLTSCGIYLDAYNSYWTISNCRFFQTASRTFSSLASYHSAIRIYSGNGHNILNNIIGYSTSTGTGTYTMTGQNYSFTGMYLDVDSVVPTSVQGNLITAFNFTNSNTSSFETAAIYIWGGSVNVGTSLANTIGGSSGTNLFVQSNTTQDCPLVGISVHNAEHIKIHNNVLGGFTSSSPSATLVSSVRSIFVMAPRSIELVNNTIGNLTAANMKSGTSGFTTASTFLWGIWFGNYPSKTIIKNNTVQNLSSYGTGSASVIGIVARQYELYSDTFLVENNTIRSLNAYGTSSSIGLWVGNGNKGQIKNNTIHSIFSNHTGTVSTNTIGIFHPDGKKTSISNNLVYSLFNSSTSTNPNSPRVTGLLVDSGTDTISVINNMITVGTGAATNTVFMGIRLNNTAATNPVYNVFHNSILVSGSVGSGAQNSYGLIRGNFGTACTVTVNIKNNLIQNNRTGGSGFHFAIANNPGIGGPIATGWGPGASDYNILNAPTAFIGYWSLSALNIVNWRTTSAGDNSSYTFVPVTFVNPANNLHLNMGAGGTNIESHGTLLPSVTTDYDGQVRPGPAGSTFGGACMPDIGADEFDGTPIITGPTLPTVVASPSTICVGATSLLHITSGFLNNALDWYWYTGSCGDTIVGYGDTLYVSPTTTTTYYVRGFGGCVNSGACTTITVTVNSVPTVGHSITPNDTICYGDSITLTGTGASSYSWSAGVVDGISFMPASSAQYIVTGSNGTCNGYDTAYVVVENISVGYNVFPNDTVCSGDSLWLSGTGGNSYIWSGGISDGAYFSPASSGSYTVIGNSVFGCSDTAIALIHVNNLPSVGYTVLSNDTVCLGTSITLSGTGGSTYSWSGGITNAVAFTPALTGTYTVVGTDGNGCSNTSVASVTVNNLPTVNYAAMNNDTICSGDSLVLSGTGASSYVWSGGVNDGIAFTPVSSGAYTVTGTDVNGCTATATADIVVHLLPTIGYTVTSNDTICSGDNIILSGTGGITYVWDGGVTDGVAFSPSSSGFYTVTGTDLNGCTNTISAMITVISIPPVNLGADIVLPSGPLVLDAGSGYDSYLWNTTAISQTISVTVNGTYIVTVQDEFGCSDSDTIEVWFTNGINDPGTNAVVVKLYPNPSDGAFNLSVSQLVTQESSIKILDMQGRVVLVENLGAIQQDIILPFNYDLNMGLYIVQLHTDSQLYNLYLVINE